MEIEHLNDDESENLESTLEVGSSIRNICSYLMQIDKKNYRIKVECDKEYYIQNIRDYFQQIMIHLINNALKYSEDNKEVNVIVKQDLNYLTIYVKDQGIGIDKKEFNKIFNDFYRGENALSFQGTGLGLGLVNKRLEDLQGSITCESELDKGSIFTIKLALIQQEALNL